MHSQKECYGGGGLSQQTKPAQSGDFPLHRHIRTSLAGEFLIHAVIFVHLPSPPVHLGL